MGCGLSLSSHRPPSPLLHAEGRRRPASFPGRLREVDEYEAMGRSSESDCRSIPSRTSLICFQRNRPYARKPWEPQWGPLNCKKSAPKLGGRFSQLVAFQRFPKSGRPDSNRRRPAWEAGILPTELRPHVGGDLAGPIQGVNRCPRTLRRRLREHEGQTVVDE